MAVKRKDECLLLFTLLSKSDDAYPGTNKSDELYRGDRNVVSSGNAQVFGSTNHFVRKAKQCMEYRR